MITITDSVVRRPKTDFIRAVLPKINTRTTAMSLRELLAALRARRRRASDLDQRGAEVTKRLRELQEHSRLVAQDNNPSRKPNEQDNGRTIDKDGRTA